jgi:Tfp pilus assembly protein PilN
MIEVNLLPEDRRPVERTPLPRFLTILGGVIGFCIEGVFIVFLLTLIPQKKGFLESLRLREKRAKAEVDQVETIKKRIKEVGERKKGIDKLANDRRLWAPILYRLCDPELLPPKVWYSELRLDTKKARRGPDEETLVIEAFAATNDEADGPGKINKATTFVRNLQVVYPQFSEQFEGDPQIVEMTNARISGANKGDADAPQNVLSFQVILKLKPKLTAQKAATPKK